MENNLYYFDTNRRVYELNGVKREYPYAIGFFRPIKVIDETKKECICEYGTINKKSKKYSNGGAKYIVYNEQEMLDHVYVAENRHLIAEKVRSLSAAKLRLIEKVLNDTSET